MTEKNNSSFAQPMSIHKAFHIIWQSRIYFFVAYIIIFTLAACLFIYNKTLDSDALAKVTFKVDFPSAEQGKYPNGDTFSPEDIIAPAVLSRVYEQQKLNGKIAFKNFASNFMILRENYNTYFLEQEYEGKLANKSLTAVQREKLENEFLSKLKHLPLNKFTLFYRDRSPAFDQEEALGLLVSVLKEWAETSAKSRGVFLVDMAPPSKESVKALAKTNVNDFILTDRFQIICQDIRSKLTQLSGQTKLPIYRTSEGLRLADLEKAVNDLQDIWLTPHLYALAKAASKDGMTGQFIESRIRTLRLKAENTKRTIDSIKATMNTVTPVETMRLPQDGQSPQIDGGISAEFTSSFLESIINLSATNETIKYRISQQSLLQHANMALNEVKATLDEYESLGDVLGTDAKQNVAPLDKKFIEDRLLWVIDGFNDLITLFSETVYNPTSAIFTVQTQYYTAHANQDNKFLVYGTMILLLLATLCIILVILYRNSD